LIGYLKMLTFGIRRVGVVTGLVSIPVAVFFVEVLASLYPVTENRADASRLNEGKRITVVVPAHNESSGIVPTIEGYQTTIGPGAIAVIVVC